MLAIFFDLTSFFDLQEWVPKGDYKKEEEEEEEEERVPLHETEK